MTTNQKSYPATLEIEYVAESDKVKALFRVVLAIPIAIVLTVLTAAGGGVDTHESGWNLTTQGGGVLTGIGAATALMIIFRQRYPRWWFDFALELNRFMARVGAYIFLLTDDYPSTVDKQSVHLDVKYPDVERDLNRWMPLVKWFLAIPHYFVLAVLSISAVLATIIAWFAILFTGAYPQNLFDFVVGVGRWHLRVYAYAFMLVTDEYPPFSLQ